MKKKQLISICCLGAVLCSGTAFAQGDANVFVNGQYIGVDSYLINDSTYIPLRAVSEAMGAAVTWDGDSKSAYIETSEDDTVSSLIERVSPSVVAVVGNYKPSYMSDAALSYNESYGFGTGVVIKSGGVILTNAHVVDELNNLTVIFNDGSSYPGTVQYIDKAADLAVVKISKLGLTPITMGQESDIVPGRTVIAIGTPLSLSFRNSATKGIISGKDVPLSDEYYHFIQSDVAINSGNSGGPLINMKGELIGINAQKGAGVGIEGMSFSIPIDTVNYVLKQFEQNGKVLRADAGASFEESWEARLGLPTNKGITVKSSSNAQLQKGDMITAVNGIAVHSIVEWNEALKDTYTAGDISITLVRDGQTLEVAVTPVLK